MKGQKNELLERYLHRATRGLWGARKAQVREELESHVWEKVARLRVSGVPEGEAVARVLLELGAPEAISRAMFRVHTAPVLAGSSLVLALVASVGIWITSQTLAQVAVTREAPKPFCKTFDAGQEGGTCIYDYGQSWISLDNLKELFSKQGISVEESPKAITLSSTNGPVITIPKIGVSNNGEQQVLTFKANNQTYVQDLFIFLGLSKLKTVPVKLEGLFNPRITVGSSSFVLGDGKTKVDARNFYLNFFNERVLVPLINNRPFSTAWIKELRWQGPVVKFSMPVQGQPGTVYAIANLSSQESSRSAAEPMEPVLTIDIVQAKPDGTIEFSSEHEKLEFSDNLDVLKRRGDATKKAVLIRFTGRIDTGDKGYAIEVPAQRIVESVR